MVSADILDGDVHELRRAIRDIVIFSTLPVGWINHAPEQIVEAVTGALLSMLDADLVYVLVPAKSGEPEIEFVRSAPRVEAHGSVLKRTLIMECRRMLQSGETATEHRFDEGLLRIISTSIELQHSAALVTGSLRASFPTQVERLLLRVCANEAATALLRCHAQSYERRCAALLQRSSDFIGFANLDGTVSYLNPAGRELVGLAPEEDLHRFHILDFVTPDERAWVRDEVWPLAMRDGRWVGEMRFHHFPTGGALPFLNDWFVIDDARTGRPLHMATISRELSARKRLEEELRNLNESLENRVSEHAEKLATANRKLSREIKERHHADARLQELQSELYHAGRLSVVGQMAATLAHELNQPLTAITNSIGAGRRLLLKPDSADIGTARHLLDDASNQALRAAQIVRRLRDFVSRGEMVRRVESVASMVEDASTLALANSEGRNVEVRFHFDPRAGNVIADRISIQLVLINLFRNALDAMAGAARRELAVTTALIDMEKIEISVADSGSGLSEDAAQHLYEPFFSTKPEGMGLGLSLCRSIIEAHEGSLRSGANPGGGTIFRFTLRAATTSPTENER